MIGNWLNRIWSAEPPDGAVLLAFSWSAVIDVYLDIGALDGTSCCYVEIDLLGDVGDATSCVNFHYTKV